MHRLVEKVVPLITPALQDRFLLAFPCQEQPKTRIYFAGKIAEIETGSLGYYFSVKRQDDGSLLASGAESTLQEALHRVFEKLGNPEMPQAA